MNETLTYRPYQLEGIKHLLSMPYGRPHALLADGPGTGKTIQAIGAAIQSGCKTGVVLVPAIAKQQWKRQMVRWGLAAEDEIQVLYGYDAQVSNAPWLVLNYDLVREPKIRCQISNRKFHCLIPDEAHRLKNHSSKTTLAVFHHSYGIANQCYWKWPMSGSIMPNIPLELYTYFATMCPEAIYPYDTYEKYINQFCGGMITEGRGVTRRNIPELTARLQRFMLRRELEDVWKECPDLIENVFPIDVNYEAHPEYIGDEFMEDATLRRVIAEAKIPQIVAYVKDRLNSGVRQIVVFTYHRKVLEGCVNALQEFQPLNIYGGISNKKREESLAKFIENPQHRVIFLQIASAGEAIDGLQYASAEYVHAEPEWTPGREDQAGRRLLRIGQQAKRVYKTTLIAADSYEERIFSRNRSKRSVIEVVTKPNGGCFVMSIEKLLEENIALLKEVNAKLGSLGDGAGTLGALLPAGQLPTATLLPAPSAVPQIPNGLTAGQLNAQVAPGVVGAAPAPFAPVAGAPFAGIPNAPAPSFPNQVAPGVGAPLNTAPSPIAVAQAAPAAPAADRKAFNDQIVEMFKPYGMAGYQVLTAEVAKYGAAKFDEIPEAHLQNFLAGCQAAIGSLAAKPAA